jgi:LptA/(LptD N-terminal domain) LPS transport protein
MRRWICLGLLITLCAAVGAQEGMKFSELVIHKAGLLKTKGSRPISMTKGVDMTLMPINPDDKPLKIKAEEMFLSYANEEARQADHVEMKKNVRVDSAEGRISSDRAVLDLGRGQLVFTGNVKSEDPSGTMNAEKVTMDLNTGEAISENVSVNISLMSAGGDAQPSTMLLRIEEVRDWKGLLTKVKAEAGADKPSPGKRIVALLSESARGLLLQLDPAQEQTADMKKGIVKEFNKVLGGKSMYDKASWEGVKLDAETTALLAKDAASAEERILVNRRLLEAAFPAEIAKRSAK